MTAMSKHKITEQQRPEVDPDWLAETLAKFTPADCRRAGRVMRCVADGHALPCPRCSYDDPGD